MCLSSVRNESHSFGKRIKFEGSSPPSFQAASHVPKKITTKPSFSTKIRFTTSNTPSQASVSMGRYNNLKLKFGTTI